MKIRIQEDGVLVRADLDAVRLSLILEPEDEGFFLNLASRVKVVDLFGATPDKAQMADIQENISEFVWLTWDGAMLELGSDRTGFMEFPCTNLFTMHRDYSSDDLRAKFEYLSRSYRSSEESTGELLNSMAATEGAIGTYIEKRRRVWTLKRDFFAGRNQEKAKEFVARLEVLDDIDSIVEGD